MRLVEALLSAASVVAFFTFLLPLPPEFCRTRCVVLIVPVMAVAQITLEGARWQMFPSYLLAVVLLLVGLFRWVVPNSVEVPQWVGGIGAVLGVLGLLFAMALPILLPVFHFPEPTGRYAIGTLTYHWVDTTRPELFTTEPGDVREILAQVWYPAQDDPSAPRAPYIPDADRVTRGMARVLGYPEFLFTHFRYVTAHAVQSAPLAEDQSSYPVLIFLSGQNGFRQMNTFQIEELVSHGYIVVGLDQPGAVALVQFPDGHQVSGLPRSVMYPLAQQSVEPLPATPELLGQPMPDGIVPYFAADVLFALDQLAALNASDPNHILTGRLDLEHAGIFGISLGGINSAEACLKDTRLKACLIMDVFMSAGVVRNGLKQPVMWITRDADTMRLERERTGGWTEKDIELHQTTMRAVYESLSGEGYYLQIPNAFHLNFTDVPYWSPITAQIGMTGPLNSQRLFDIVNAYSVAFFDKHLRGQPAPLLAAPSPLYPEVNFETRRP